MPRKQTKKIDEERVNAHSKEALVALAKRRGYRNPDVWAMKIIQARQRKKFL